MCAQKSFCCALYFSIINMAVSVFCELWKCLMNSERKSIASYEKRTPRKRCVNLWIEQYRNLRMMWTIWKIEWKIKKKVYINDFVLSSVKASSIGWIEQINKKWWEKESTSRVRTNKINANQNRANVKSGSPLGLRELKSAQFERTYRVK